MTTWRNESEAREEIKQLVEQYYHEFLENQRPYQKGGRISYGGRVFDAREVCALTDATLDFWLTTGRFSERFEQSFAAFLGVKYVHLVNSGSSANLLAFMTLTSPKPSLTMTRGGTPAFTASARSWGAPRRKLLAWPRPRGYSARSRLRVPRRSS